MHHTQSTKRDIKSAWVPESDWVPETDWKTKSAWVLERGFELERVRKGVARGERHSAFNQYLGWMAKENFTRQQAHKEISAWNRLNNPPLEEQDITDMFNERWHMWAEKGQE